MKSKSRTMTVAALVGGLLAGSAGVADAGPRVKWKMQSAWSTSVPLAGESGVRFTKAVQAMSEDKFQIKFFDPGALVPALEAFDAVSKGSIESAWTTPGYHTGKYPGLAFVTTVPFGPQIGEFLAWKWYGGGNAIRDKIYEKHGLIAFDAFSHGPETSGWFKEPIQNLEQLKGLKMRFFGLGARVMQKMGVSTQLLAGADIYPALERGVIDATEYSMPINDIKYGFYQIAKHNYYPGWHQQVSVSEFLMNREAFDKLPVAYQTIIENAAKAQVIQTYADGDARNFGPMMEMKSKYGVTNHRWPDSVLSKFELAWLDIVQEESAKDPIFKEFADSYLSFRKSYKIWADAQSLRSTYQE